MKDMTSSPEAGWNLLLVVALVSLPIFAWYGFGQPAAETGQTKKKVDLAMTEIRKADKEATESVKALQAKTTEMDNEVLAAATLSQVTKLAQGKGLLLRSFRTDRATDVAGISESPFIAVLEGPFPSVLNFTRSLEGADSKLAVEMMQLSSSDSKPGNVTATLGLVGFQFKEKEEGNGPGI